MDNNLSDSDLENLKTAARQGAVAWDNEVDRIKKKYGGYPQDWYTKIILSGIVGSVGGLTVRIEFFAKENK